MTPWITITAYFTLAEIAAIKRFVVAILMGSIFAWFASAAHAKLYAIDGDTLIETATMERIRLENVDAPELRARCQEEAHLAQRAKEFVAAMLARHGAIVHPIGRLDRYGRTLALVEIRGYGDLGRLLIDAKLAREYHGGKRAGWC